MLFNRRHLFNESQTRGMYCLWFIPIIVVTSILMMSCDEHLDDVTGTIMRFFVSLCPGR